MASIEISFIWQIIVDLIIGAVLGAAVEQLQRAILAAGVAAFCFSIFLFAFGDPDSLRQLTISEANEKITIIVTVGVSFIVHLLFVEIGATPTNLILNRYFRN